MSRKMIDYKAEDGKIKSIDGYKVGGDYSVKVERIESDFSGSGGSNMRPYWDSTNIANIIQPNTHYDLGFTTIICYQFKYKTQKLEPNQFIVPIGSYHITNRKPKAMLQYGEVVLQLVSAEPKFTVLNDEEGSIDTMFYLTYTVTTPGTTGDTVKLPEYISSPFLVYEVVTLGIQAA